MFRSNWDYSSWLIKLMKKRIEFFTMSLYVQIIWYLPKGRREADIFVQTLILYYLHLEILPIQAQLMTFFFLPGLSIWWSSWLLLRRRQTVNLPSVQFHTCKKSYTYIFIQYICSYSYATCILLARGLDHKQKVTIFHKMSTDLMFNTPSRWECFACNFSRQHPKKHSRRCDSPQIQYLRDITILNDDCTWYQGKVNVYGQLQMAVLLQNLKI